MSREQNLKTILAGESLSEDFARRIEELSKLRDAWRDPTTPFILQVAAGDFLDAVDYDRFALRAEGVIR